METNEIDPRVIDKTETKRFIAEAMYTIRNCPYISEASLYEQLTEELCELAAETAKYARILRNEMPTSETLEGCREKVTEEATDVRICLDLLMLHGDDYIYIKKLLRMLSRLGI